MDAYQRKIAEYYDITLPWYKWFWHKDAESNALHYGFWDKGTKTVKEALINENRLLANLANVTDGTEVLDAGCGVGGSAIWLAKNLRALVTGITISEKQLAKAQELAKEHGVDAKTKFYLKDYLDTEFPDESFDVVWAIESVCHAVEKKDFLKEAYRVLRRGGRLIVADIFLKRDIMPHEVRAYNEVLEGLVVPNLAKTEDFKNWMHEVGFRNITSLDKTDEAQPSSKILYHRVSMFYPVVKLLCAVGLLSDVLMKNGRAGLAQWELAKSGLPAYGVFYGEK